MQIQNGDTVDGDCSGGGVLEPEIICEAVERRFSTRSPRGLTLVHAGGFGDKKETGLNRFAHEGLVRRVIGGHGAGPAHAAACRPNRSRHTTCRRALWRCSTARSPPKPGLIKLKIGLGTFVDPRISAAGSRHNQGLTGTGD
jgi:propionate CoA-transferase